MPHQMVLKGPQFMQLLDENGYKSVNQFCKAANLHPGSVSRVLTGKATPGVRFIAATSYTLNTPIETFIRIEEI